MAFNRRNKPKPPPMCASTRPSKTSKKRSHSISTPFAPVAKKARPKAVPQPLIHVSPLLCSEVSLFMPSLLVFTQPLLDVDVEDNDKGEEKVKDNDTKELLLPLAVVCFMSVWKAFNGKEVLPGNQSAMLDQDILYLTAIEA